MTNNDPALRSWLLSAPEPNLPSIDEVREAAGRLHRQVQRRNAREYGASVLVVAVFTLYAFMLEHVLERIGAALVVVGTLFVAWQISRRASSTPVEQAGAVPIYVFMREQLERQRVALASVVWWYILPFVPGLLLMMAGNAMLQAGRGAAAWIALWFAAALLVALFVGVWWINRRVAKRLQEKIDEIDALLG